MGRDEPLKQWLGDRVDKYDDVKEGNRRNSLS